MQTLEQVRIARNRVLSFKHILPLQEKLELLNTIPKSELSDVKIFYKDSICIEIPHISVQSFNLVCEVARALIPWRKGPFKINDLEILSEWDSAIKYNLLESHLDLKDKIIGDIGCNNGYYMFRMLAQNPKQILGFDPMPLCFLQYKFLQFFAKEARLNFELLGIEELGFFTNSFDIMLCLGVLYHRKSPLDSIKLVFNSLKKGGEAVFDSLIIDGEGEIALCPKERYAKMPNVYFIPTLNTFRNWLESCGFKEVLHIATLKTAFDEQRKTEWSNGESLEDFLDSTGERTIEGYPAPKRAYLKAKKV
ncbi:tRNA 5-methoxyuridine(34)/uridine 5-oxyacetic acid(34) synthase CmoB [Helicobacter winghamensis]|uniref:tRNA 5-methoxyuridine(34)/uridine 5-oxyacetic acid(34) synthase CmoB n=1 Tax=Helicobacter winghamensis TaxID=157268 RepID=UPI0001A27B47|nr:tRNA 5-methoxyuridine(34)/uridine 5-oxyacetic acid(34) synthase CmoB [Helicobacter winghamensis]EEO25826.1 putative methyltransferase [Helicobacter winghamensis ATCC BAA-430]PKT78884.1 tRNA 5-methoxyuridine(34) synthase CmoB [Helicobacter winghamensis]PKT79048.1 tRNA 5-methoxyuridine(34) synthase CmoB [Helicobacter winghamensis]